MQLTAAHTRAALKSRPSGGLIRAILEAGVILAALLLVAELDRATGSAPVQHLYYLPIVGAAVRFGLVGGIVVPLVAVVLYHLANPRLLELAYGHWDFVQVMLFVAIGLMTTKFAHDRHRLRMLATTDDLTGLHNLRSFEIRLAELVRTARVKNAPLALLVLDLDNLKSVNDAHGHLAGAEAVRTVGHVIAERAPDEAVSCRYGGDEFVMAVPGYSQSAARELADELRHAIASTAPILDGLSFPARTLSVSVGVAWKAFDQLSASSSAAEMGEELFRSADAALYLAKERGRNRVCVA